MGVWRERGEAKMLPEVKWTGERWCYDNEEVNC